MHTIYKAGYPKEFCLYLQTIKLVYELIACSISLVCHRRLNQQLPEKSTLIVYLFRNSDPEAINNLVFFIEHGIVSDDGARCQIAAKGLACSLNVQWNSHAKPKS